MYLDPIGKPQIEQRMIYGVGSLCLVSGTQTRKETAKKRQCSVSVNAYTSYMVDHAVCTFLYFVDLGRVNGMSR
jgi:hypothetical protein